MHHKKLLALVVLLFLAIARVVMTSIISDAAGK
jgi:hypothetical protein